METILIASFIIIFAGLAIRLVNHNNKTNMPEPPSAPVSTPVSTPVPTPTETVKEIAASAEAVTETVETAAPAKKTKAPAKAKTPKVPGPKTPRVKKSA